MATTSGVPSCGSRGSVRAVSPDRDEVRTDFRGRVQEQTGGTRIGIRRSNEVIPRTFKYTIDEVMVDVGRDGEPLLVERRYQSYFAKVAGVDTIQVLPVVRHREGLSTDSSQ